MELSAQAAETPADTHREGDAPELTEAADRAMERGMQYLLSTQNPDGSWSNADGNFKMAATARRSTARRIF